MKKKRALLLALMIMGFIITSLGLCIFCIFAIHWPEGSECDLDYRQN